MTAAGIPVRLTQRVRFEAAHRLVSPLLDDAQNDEVYGKCARPGGHGHNYEVEVTLRGTPDPRTGLICGRDEFRAAIHTAIVARCDHRDLNTVVDAITTGENLARIFFDWVASELPASIELYRVRVYETARNVFDAFAQPEEETACRS